MHKIVIRRYTVLECIPQANCVISKKKLWLLRDESLKEMYLCMFKIEVDPNNCSKLNGNDYAKLLCLRLAKNNKSEYKRLVSNR